MRLNRAVAIAAALSVVLVMSLSGPAAAFEIIATHGPFGEFGYLPADDEVSPAAKCGYSGVLADNYAHLRWIKVRAPIVVARDVTGGRDHQTVSWQVKLQRQRQAGGWKTVAKSATQSRTAYDDQGAAFSDIKVYTNRPGNSAWRAIVLLKWWRHGSVEAWAKLRIQFYLIKANDAAPGQYYADYCAALWD